MSPVVNRHQQHLDDAGVDDPKPGRRLCPSRTGSCGQTEDVMGTLKTNVPIVQVSNHTAKPADPWGRCGDVWGTLGTFETNVPMVELLELKSQSQVLGDVGDVGSAPCACGGACVCALEAAAGVATNVPNVPIRSENVCGNRVLSMGTFETNVPTTSPKRPHRAPEAPCEGLPESRRRSGGGLCQGRASE